MDRFLVSAAMGALKPVLGKLAILLGDEYKRLKAVRGEIKFLRDELAAMHAFLFKMSEEENPDEQDKVWMTAVRELSYDMEDSIDDFMQGVGDKDTKPDGFIEKIKSSLGKLGKMKARRRIGHEIQDLKKQIIEVGKRNQRYKTRQAFCNSINTTIDLVNTTIDRRALAIFEHASKFVGIDESKGEIIKLLTEEDGVASEQQQLKVLSIFGSGGMGETTLANQVYQDLRGQFECTAFLSVSRNPDMMVVLRTILSDVTGQPYAATEEGSIQKLISKISDFLTDKRYFLVVDDIWKEESWDVIRCAFPMTNSGSKIITTTQISNVAPSCISSFKGHIYNIRPLNMVHLRQLLHGRLFNSIEGCPSYLEEVSDQVLQKCDGLPLAIIAISGLLANREETEHHWSQVRDSIGRALERNPSVEGMMKILSLSYFDLPLHLRSCLLYLSIFPEDSIIWKKDLIRRWIAEGFIHKEGIYTVFELAERCFTELVNRSLIQPVEMTRYDEVMTFRFHDIILDFLISKSFEENFLTLVGVPDLKIATQSKVRRLAMQVANQGNSFLPRGLALSHVRSLSVFGEYVEIPSLCKFKHLRVLDFKFYEELQNHQLKNIVSLCYLRYLNISTLSKKKKNPNISNTDVSELPNQIGRLRSLEMLDLRGTDIIELPGSIVNLEKLVHLIVEPHVKFSDGIAKLQALEMLCQVYVSGEPIKFLQELGQLKNLRKLVLCFKFDYDAQRTVVSKECEKAVAFCLHNLVTQSLRSLEIGQGADLLQGAVFSSLVGLENLVTRWSFVPQVPKCVESLINLQKLRLDVRRLEQEDLNILGGLPTLLILELHYVGRWTFGKRVRISGEFGFQCLRQFVYDMGSCGMNVVFAAGSMPSLVTLDLIFHAEETEAFDFGIENLPRLISLRCRAFGNIEALKAEMDRAANTIANYPSVIYVK